MTKLRDERGTNVKTRFNSTFKNAEKIPRKSIFLEFKKKVFKKVLIYLTSVLFLRQFLRHFLLQIFCEYDLKKLRSQRILLNPPQQLWEYSAPTFNLTFKNAEKLPRKTIYLSSRKLIQRDVSSWNIC